MSIGVPSRHVEGVVIQHGLCAVGCMHIDFCPPIKQSSSFRVLAANFQEMEIGVTSSQAKYDVLKLGIRPY